MAGIFCARRLLAAGIFTLLLTPALIFAQYPAAPWRKAQGLTNRTQNDLQRASHFAPSVSGHEVERYNNAIRHLSDFDRELTIHRFDKGKLDRSIGDVQSVIDHNTLSGRSRRELLRDVTNLRRLRADYDAWHG
ncbi:MAG: hypothetical protein ACRD4P_08705 [Bryobacteraceae bacterium]